MLQLTDEEDRGKPDSSADNTRVSGDDATFEGRNDFMEEESKIAAGKP